MFFTVTIPEQTKQIDFRGRILLRARQCIMFYPFGTNEQRLDDFCRQNYHKTLRQICYSLLFASKFMLNDTEVVITFLRPEDNALAEFITYGDGDYQGSAILRTALSN